jgi:RNA polymerase-interacting CarD/CdnL/TRCF family regulator
MQFSVGDKVIHPQYGPGQITGIEGQGPSDEERRHYVIEIPRKGLTVHTPVGKADALGIRHAMSPSLSRQIVRMLHGRADALPEDYRERQDQVLAKLQTGQAVPVASVVRDLSWRQKRGHLTKRDTDLLRQGLDLLSSEMALVSGESVSEVRELIGTTLSAAMTGAAE